VTPQIIEIACPESLAPLMMALASAYQRDVAAVQIVVLPRADTLALNALTNGDVDIAALAWWPETLPESVWLAPFARDALAIVVHPRNGLPGVTMEQLRQLFRGQVEDWQLWGGLPGPPQIISREEASGEFGYFQRKVMVDARVALTGLLAPTSDAVLESVGNDPLAVGYLSTAWLDGRVRAVTIEGIPPAQETIAVGLYPLYRDLTFATMSDPEGPARDFVQWVLGPEGQNVVAAQRFVPVGE
jgi:phosphate transport system substrate-binding protein